MTETEFTSYFEGIAGSLAAIADDPSAKLRRFARLEEVWDGLRAGIDARTSLLLVVQNEKGNIEGLGAGNLVERHRCAFAVVRQCRAGDYPAIRAAYDDSLQAARAILGRMARDKADGHQLMYALELHGISFQKLGPFLDLCYGYEITFSMAGKTACLFKHDPLQWL
jgi:hypothetical protein